jgi:Peptidase_C39 like family/Secretion system C-terminal sorting domain
MVKIILLLFTLLSVVTFGQTYPDQFYSYQNDSLMMRIEKMNGMEIASNGKSVILSEGFTDGSVIFKADSSGLPFDRGLPSWNGHVPSDKSSFKVLIRFYKNSWSPWLTIGFWKQNIWSSYGSTSFSGGKIDIDNAVLNSYYTKWQFQVVMKRSTSNELSPDLYKLSFYVSDSKTPIDITSIVNDKPAAIFIPTQHYYQYALDPGIGGDICSPTSVSMVLRSYDIKVDPLQFAKDNYDDYWGMFGIWPRAVQNAAEYKLNGAVTRYRTWSETREVLAAGGRIVMSVGPPLYTGHLMMLAGFDAQGNPLVHDPAQSNGYGYKFNKTSLSQSWFSKGGIAYTFFYEDTANVASVENSNSSSIVETYNLSVYPNPFNPQTNINLKTNAKSYTEITIYDITGREVKTIYKDILEPGTYNFSWNASDLPSGMYFIHTTSGSYNKTIKAVLIK